MQLTIDCADNMISEPLLMQSVYTRREPPPPGGQKIIHQPPTGTGRKNMLRFLLLFAHNQIKSKCTLNSVAGDDHIR